MNAFQQSVLRRAVDRASGVVVGLLIAGSLAVAAPVPTVSRSIEPVIARAAREIGFRRCLPLITATAQRATAGASRQDILLDWDHRAPDAGPLFSLTAMNVGPQSAVLVLSALPVSGNQPKCSLAVERISATAQACETVARTELQGYQRNDLLPNVTVYTVPGRQTESITLVNSDGACLIIRRQISIS